MVGGTIKNLRLEGREKFGLCVRYSRSDQSQLTVTRDSNGDSHYAWSLSTRMAVHSSNLFCLFSNINDNFILTIKFDSK